LRNEVYGPKLSSELFAHQLSAVSGTFLFAIVIWAFLYFTKAKFNTKDLLLIGVIWLSMTIGFEFLFGHFVAGHSWKSLFSDYNILAGRIWIIVLLFTLLGHI